MPQTPVPLDELVANVTEDAEFEAQARRCHVRTVIPEGDWQVRGNASLGVQLRRRKRCAERDSLHSGRDLSRIELKSENREGVSEAVLGVRDSGPGVPADSLGKLFEPFYRLDDARGRLTGGVGLGLAITERAVRFRGSGVQSGGKGFVSRDPTPLIFNGQRHKKRMNRFRRK